MALSIKGGKLTGRLLAKAMAAALRQMQKARAAPKVGQQSMKRLTRTGEATSNIEVMGRIKSFDRVARKYGVGYHIEKDVDTGKFTVYFKAKQADALMGAFGEYSKKMLAPAAEKKPSVLAALQRFKEVAKAQPDRVKNKERGGPEL